MAVKKNIVAGLDLGTTKVCAAIAEKNESGKLRILGFGAAVSEGLHKGLVTNISKTSEAIREAMNIASNIAGLNVSKLNVGVAGEHIRSMRHRNYVMITNEEREITQADLDRLEQDVRTVRIPSDMQILHIIPEEYFVDQGGHIHNPLGMSGGRLEATNHIVLASVPAIQNIKKSVERAGYTVGEYILQPLASSLAVLDKNERDLGVMMLDIGGGTTDIALIHQNAIKHSKVFGIAGNHVTNDVREALGVITSEAEQLKKTYGCATPSVIIKDEDILIKGVGARGNSKIPISLLAQIVGSRMKELFEIIDQDIRSSGLKGKIKSGIVLTGGGSLLAGTADLAREVFSIPARIGVPLDSVAMGLSDIEKPEYATVIGLLQGIPGSKSSEHIQSVKTKKNKSNKLNQVFSNLINFFNDL